jgi:hypothetical protein
LCAAGWAGATTGKSEAGTRESAGDTDRRPVGAPPGRCVVTDDVSVLLLSGRFIVDDPGCPRVVDSFAANLALTDGHVGQFEESEAVQRAWLAWLERADVVVSDEPTLSQAAPEDGWGQEVQRYLRVHFVLVNQTETVSIYRRVVGASR